MKTYLLATLVALNSITVFAQDQFGRNVPMQQLVRATADGKLELLTLMTRCMPVTKSEAYTVKVPVQENGKQVFKTEEKLRTICEMVTECEIYTSPLELNALKVFETDGRAVDVKTLAKRLKGPTLVVVSSDEKMIAPYYAGVFKAGTLIVAHLGYGNAPPAQGIALPPKAASVNDAAASPVRFVSQEEFKSEPPPTVPTEAPVAKVELGIKTPKSLAPTMLFARVPEAGKINLRYYTEGIGEREVMTEVVQKGVPNTVQIKQLQKFTRSESTQLNLIDVKATTADGKTIDAPALAAKLKTASVVFASAMGQQVDPFWLQNVKPDVVVLTPPQGVGFGAAACFAMPAPVPPRKTEVAPQTAPAPVPAPAPKETPEGKTKAG